MHPSLSLDEATPARFCRKHHFRQLSLFGSQLKGNARTDSDIDLLMESEPGHVPAPTGMAAMEFELSDLLGGKKVDLRTANDLSRHFRDEIVQTAELQHAR